MVTFVAKLEIRVDRDGGRKDGINGTLSRFKKGAGALPYNTARRVQKYARAKAAVRTGYMKSSIIRERIGLGSHKVTVGAPYGIYVNYGTRHMRAQPFWEPAINQARLDMKAEIRKMLHG